MTAIDHLLYLCDHYRAEVQQQTEASARRRAGEKFDLVNRCLRVERAEERKRPEKNPGGTPYGKGKSGPVKQGRNR
jgi:hypothetical protein